MLNQSNDSKKALILSSSGLKNVIFTSNEQKELLMNDNVFRFIFGKKEIKMNRILADFISPRVSLIHHSDITIDTIDLSNMINIIRMVNDQFSQTELITDEISSLLLQLSSGYEIEVNQSTSQAIKFISILIGNEELYQKTLQLFPNCYENCDKEDIDNMVQYLLTMNKIDSLFYDEEIISFLSQNFYLIKEELLLKLPKTVLYSIISNENLKLESEDSLIDFIYNLFYSNENEENKDDDTINSIAFLEQVNFTSLNENKFREVIELIEPNQITKSLWEKLFECFKSNSKNSPERSNNERYTSFTKKKKKIIQIPYDQNPDHRFSGIISYLTNEYKDLSEDVIKTSSSSHRSERSHHRNILDFKNSDVYFGSKNEQNSWLRFDFLNRRVRINYYSIKSWNDKKGNHHLKNWKIQASNDGVKWKTLDSKAIDTSLDGPYASNTFDIRNSQYSSESYKYIQITQTGLNSGGTLYLNIKSIEFFGDILDE